MPEIDYSLQLTAGQDNFLTPDFLSGKNWEGFTALFAVYPETGGEPSFFLTTSGGGITTPPQGPVFSISAARIAELGFSTGFYALKASSPDNVEILSVTAPITVV